MKNKKLKAIALSMGLGVTMLTATPAQAQMIELFGERLFGLFNDNYYNEEPEYDEGLFNESNHNRGLMNRGGIRGGGSNLGNETFGEAGSEIENEPFGAPIGGGTGILIAAGLGYAFIQSKKNKQN